MSISINGNGITSANIADGAITNADITDVAASKLTGALPAISGAALTNLPASGLSAASDAEVRTGTSTAVAVTPANIKATQLGWGQSWTNVTASRAENVTYTNTTGRPIEIFVVTSSSSGSTNSALVIAGISVQMPTIYTTNWESSSTVVIPNGTTYKLDGTGIYLNKWLELR